MSSEYSEYVWQSQGKCVEHEARFRFSGVQTSLVESQLRHNMIKDDQ